MAKVTLDNVTSGLGAVSTINTNMDRIEVAMEKTLSRDGSTPNQMEAPLDMNSQRILNLPDAVNSHEPLTLGQAAELVAIDTPLTEENVSDVLRALTSDEALAGLTSDDIDTSYEELDIRRYGAVADWNGSSGTDNLPALEAAHSVAVEKGGGVIVIRGGGTFWCSDSFAPRGDNMHIYIEPGTHLKTTTPTSLGGALVFAPVTPGDYATPVKNVGVYGGGSVSATSLSANIIGITQANPAVITTATPHGFDDSFVDTVRFHSITGMTELNGTTQTFTVLTPTTFSIALDTSGFTAYVSGGVAELENENAISFVATHGFFCVGMNIPEANRKAIAMQINCHDGWIAHNTIGTTGHTAIESKGSIDVPTADYNNKNITIIGNDIVLAGNSGIESTQPSTGTNNDSDIRVLSNVVRESVGTSFRMERVDRLVFRGNSSLESGNNGAHIKECKDVRGDVHSVNAAVFGLHLQENDGFDLSSVTVYDAGSEGVRETDDVSGGFIGRLRVEGSTHTAGYRAVTRGSGSQVVVVSDDVSAGAGVKYQGEMPNLIRGVRASKLQSFVLVINNNGGTIRHRIVEEGVNTADSNYADRINGATMVFTNTPTGDDASTAMAGGGKISSANTNEFILDVVGTPVSGDLVVVPTIEFNDSTVDLNVGVRRRTHDVNGVVKTRYHLYFTNNPAGTAYNINTLGSGLTIHVRVLMWIP